jgi:AcrR family transcriptional regulator
MEPLSISELERETGVGRSTIHYYLAHGLLPPAQKASATRAIYDRSHVDLLREIARLKAEGLGLKVIKERLRERIEAAAGNGVDLVARQSEEARNAILQAAARRFAEHGYDGTRLSDICEDAGVASQTLYANFPSKKHLFVACYQVYFDWMHALVTPPIEQTSNTAARLAWRSFASYGIRALSPDLQAMARVEALHEEGELRSRVQDVYRSILAGTAEELAAERRPGPNESLFDDELVAYALIGALENMQMRATWDDAYTREDVMANLVAMFLALRAAYAGRVDLSGEWSEVAELVRMLAARAGQREGPPSVTG